MENLPLTKKLDEDNIFNRLNLPLSSKWADVQKAYDGRAKTLKSAIGKADGAKKADHEQELARLDASYRSFSSKLGEENAGLHQTREALRAVGLTETADWDKVASRFDEIRAADPAKAATLQREMDTLAQNRSFLERNPRWGKRTLLTTALVLGAAGISWAACSHLSESEKGDMLQTLETEGSQAATAEGSAAASEVPSLIDEADLERYVEENTAFEDEMLALLGLLPSPGLSLALQYKMRVFASLAKAV